MIKLTLGSVSVEITKFRGSTVPRSRPNIAQISYSAYGTPLYDGSQYEAPHEWTINAVVGAADKLAIAQIFTRSMNERLEVTVEDFTDQFVEYGAQSRAEATGATVTTSGGFARYYATYKALFDGEPVFEKLGANWGVEIVLKESAIVAFEEEP